jgi:WD40 repeat protein
MVTALVWTPNGEQLLSGGSDGTLRWWDVQREECLRIRKAHQGTLRSLKVSPHGRLCASCGDDHAIHLWELTSGERRHTHRHERPYERLDISGTKGLAQAQKASLYTLGAIERPPT